MPAIQPASVEAEGNTAWNDYLDLRATELAFLNRKVTSIICILWILPLLAMLGSNYPQNPAMVLFEISFVISCLLVIPQHTSTTCFAIVKARVEGIVTVLQLFVGLSWNFIASSSLHQVGESFENCSDLNITLKDDETHIRNAINFTEIGSSLIRLKIAMTGDYCQDTHALMALFISMFYIFFWASEALLIVLILRPARFHYTIMMVVLPGGILCGQMFASFAKWGARPFFYCSIGLLMLVNCIMLLWVPYNSGKLRYANFLHERRQSREIKHATTKVAQVEAQNEKMVLQLKAATTEIKKVMAEGSKVLAAYELRSTDIEFASPARKLGEGSFGTVVWAVYRGEHEVAVKTMRVSKVSESVLKKFKSEIIASSFNPLTPAMLGSVWTKTKARKSKKSSGFPLCLSSQIMAPLHHPNLVRLFGGVWNEGADKLCIVLEFCGKGSLKTFLAEDSGTWEDLRYGLALGIAKGLRYLHHDLKEPLIHRDVKPDNILIGEGTVAKLADFGESTNFDTERAKKGADASGEDALTMTMVGTQCYCAPEIMARERYNESVDTFSFALVLLCLAVGNIDFVAEKAVVSPKELRYLLGGRPVIPSELRAKSPQLVSLIVDMWKDEFRDRPTLKEVLLRLEACASIGGELQLAPPAYSTAMAEEDAALEAEIQALQARIRELKASRHVATGGTAATACSVGLGGISEH